MKTRFLYEKTFFFSLFIYFCCCSHCIFGADMHYAEEYDGEAVLKWKYEPLDKEGNIIDDFDIDESGPVIGSDGTIYVGGDDPINDNSLYALNPDGTLKWLYKTHHDKSINSTPAILQDGTIYFGDSSGYFYALTKSGTLKWVYETDSSIVGSPAIGYDGIVYIGSTDGFLYALTQNGELIWKYKAGRGTATHQDRYYNIESSPAIGHDGTVYIGSGDSHLYALTPYGTLKWKFKARHFIEKGSPAIGSDGTVYFTCHGHSLYALTPSGDIKWEYKMGDPGYTSPAIAADGTIYAGSYTGDDMCLHAINSDGTLKWKFKTEGYIKSSPAIGSDGTIFFGSGDDFFYAINPDGTIKWRYDIGKSLKSSLSIAADGTVYTGIEALYAFQTESYGYQSGSPWPCFMYNNTRSVANKSAELPDLYRVRGQVAMPDSTPLIEIDVSVDGLTETTDEYGYFSFRLPDGSYTLTIHVTSTQIPEFVDFVVDGSDVTIDLYKSQKHIISGRIVQDGQPVSGIHVMLLNKTDETDTHGCYSFEVPDGTHELNFDVGSDRFPDGITVAVSGSDVTVEDISLNTILWVYEIDNEIYDIPVLGPDGTIYFVRKYDRYALEAVSPDGTLKWKFRIEDDLAKMPSIGQDNTVYLPCWLSLRAINPDGSLKWRFSDDKYGFGSVPVLVENGTLYVSGAGYLYAVTQNGSVIWKYPVEDGNDIGSSPSLGSDGTIYFSCYDKHVYALNPDGTLEWKYESDHPFHSTPVLGQDGTIYIGGYDNYFHAINPDGTIKWKYETETAITSNTDIASDGTILFTNQRNVLYALNPDGTLKWKHEGIQYSKYSFTMTPQYGIFYKSNDGYLVSLDLNGTVKWKHKFRDISAGLPVFSHDGVAYSVMNARIGNQDKGYLYAVRFPDIGDPVFVEHNFNGEIVTVNDSQKAITLGQNCPNPFNPMTSIPFTLAKEMHVKLTVYNVTGEKIATLADGAFHAGMHRIAWNASGHASGIYFYKLNTGENTETKKMLLVK